MMRWLLFFCLGAGPTAWYFGYIRPNDGIRAAVMDCMGTSTDIAIYRACVAKVRGEK